MKILEKRYLFRAALMGTLLTNFITIKPCFAGIQIDQTAGSQVQIDTAQQIYNISGGRPIDHNLLHSFLNFSVEQGWTATFQIPANVNIFNIIARITGNNPSLINGTLQVGDSFGHPVNLFLINPSGIIFGPGASLNLSGSFVASTAESINFSIGYQFSANNAQPVPTLLTLGVPIGLQFGANPGPIVGEFDQPGSGLFVEEGQTLALVGGDVKLKGVLTDPSDPFSIPAGLFAFNGRLEIGSAAAGETVGLLNLGTNQSLALDFSGVKNFRDIEITNGLQLGGGLSDVFLYGRQIQLDRVQIGGPIDIGSTVGSISIFASDLLALKDTEIVSVTYSSSANGDIKIQAKTLSLTRSKIDASTQFGDGNNVGQAGNITIQSNNIFLKENSFISTSSFSSGSAGRIQINADSLSLDNSSILSSSRRNGSAGEISIFARSILLDNQASISAKSTTGMGGNINLAVQDALVLRNQSNISTSSTTTGNGGNINILAGLIAAVPSEDSNISTDAVFGNGGNISITTQGLFGIAPNTANFPNSSDITARSEFGLNGTVDTNIVSTNPVVDLAALPTVLGTKIIETACLGDRRGDRDSFIYSGRGGLPATPSDPAQGSAVWQDLRLPLQLNSQPKSSPNSALLGSSASSSSPSTAPIIEAQGWVFEPSGAVRLVAAANTANPPQTKPCQFTRVSPATERPLVAAVSH